MRSLENYGNADYNLALAEVKAQVKVKLAEFSLHFESPYEDGLVDAYQDVIEILESMEA
ncbi:hypothetical protein cd3_107 [Carnobacterium phage cd3]|uniref:Uncharacterized protein n=2 Tax=Carnodivirus TaxID=3044682 RepID=A0AAE7SSI6_9CAUD|nr:hypothetical protein PQD68_gp107 [Carnobacterium phage cd2]YP_010676572.1 hypothetical protein PQD69_gp106 [Carnobacterium phage cd4]QXP45123.1 hypothetical protein cd2_107 [Carnobacterium phage cd2]QXP45321.1 hypothetical protein cd3_107 [Carnobacterium phage cd3]QXP45404.1 hypothetical protein cd4_106 [Carnobacterium phage cd4]